MITRERLLHLFSYDRDRGILIWKNPPKQNPYLIGKRAGTEHIDRNGKVYLRVCINKKRFMVHQVICLIETGTLPDLVDHIDGNTLNNEFENLRITTNRLNQHNRNRHREGRLVGASWCKTRNKWQSHIQIKGRSIALGRFNTEKEAHHRYLSALKEYENEL